MVFSRRSHLDAGAVALMVALCAAWGLQQVVVKVTNPHISPLLQAGIRSIGATVLVWLWARYRSIPLFNRDGSLFPGLVAATFFAGEFALLYLGLSYTTASRGVLFLYTAPFIVAIGAHLLLPGERLGRLQWAGLLCAFAGIATAFADGLRLPTYRELIGDLMVFVAAIFWGATTLVIRTSTLSHVSPSKTLFYQLAGSAVLLPAASWLMDEPGVTSLSAAVLGSLAFQIVAVAFVSYLAWFWLVAHYPAARLAAFSFLTPLFGMVAGGMLLGERITPALALAMALVASGIYLVNRPRPG